MSDNTTLANPAGSTAADTIRDIDRGGLGVKTQVVQLDIGGASSESLVTGTMPVSGTVTTTPPANASTNIAQVGGSALTEGQKAMAASVPVVIASDQSAVSVSGTVTTTPPANASTNIAQVGGAAVSLGAKASASSIPVVLATDEAALPVSGTVTANQGAAAALASAWPTELTDGTTGPVAVKAASTAAAAADKALVVAVSPNNSVAVTQATAANLNATVTGTVTTTPPANASTNIAQVGGVAVSLGAKASASSIPVVLATDEATLPVSGTVTTTPPANASTNVAQLAGTATSVNSGTKDAGTLRVVLATDQPALTNKLLVTPDSVALPLHQSVNVDQIGGAAVTLGAKASASSIPVVLATDEATLPVSGTVTTTPPANASTNVAQFGGVNISTGTGTGGTGIPRVTVSSDSFPATQLVSVTTLPLPANAAQETGGNLATLVSLAQQPSKSVLTDGDGIPYVNPSAPTADIATATLQQQVIAAILGPALSPAPATSVTNIGTNSVPVLPLNIGRRGAVITNVSTSGQRVALSLTGAPAVLDTGIVLWPGDSWDMDRYTFTTNAIQGIASAASGALAAQEFN